MQEPVLFIDKQLVPFQDKDIDITAETVQYSETEAMLEEELFTEIEELQPEKLVCVSQRFLKILVYKKPRYTIIFCISQELNCNVQNCD